MTTSAPTGQPDIDWSLLPTEARTELAAAYQRVVALIDEIGARNPQAGLNAAGQLSRLLGGWQKEQSDDRALYATTIRDREKLTLAGLADYLDVSKTLAARWVKAAETIRAGGTTPTPTP